jgi:hypothetical protein
MIRRALSFCVTLVLVATCASEPPPPLVAARRSPIILDLPPPAPVPEAPPPAAPVRPPPSPVDDVVKALGVSKTDLIWSAARRSFAVVLPVKPAAPKPRRPSPTMIAVHSSTGERLGTFRALGTGPVSELRFLGEDRLTYRLPVTPSARPPARPAPLRYAIQPTKAGAAPVVCTGWHFVLSPAGNHVAYVGGDKNRQRLLVDGEAVYPRHGFTTLRGEPAWASDSLGLAAIESGAHRQLVVLVEFDNPTGDNTWRLPPEADDPSLHVFWAGPGKLVVGPSLTKPVFAASFHRDPAPVVSLPPQPGRP